MARKNKVVYPALGSTSRYVWDFRRFLASGTATIVSYTVAVPTGCTLLDTVQVIDPDDGITPLSIITAQIAVPMDENMSYDLVCTVTTSGGDVEPRTITARPVKL